MAAENPLFDAYRNVVHEVRNYTFLTKADDQFEIDVKPLVTAVLTAHEAGFSDEAILAAIREGIRQGTLEIVDPADQVEDDEYWDDVRTEAEAFWTRRYDPDAPEDWS